MEQANYSVAQWVVFQTGRLIVGNAKRNLTELQGFSGSYTNAMLDALLVEIDDAEALPSEAERAQLHKQLLVELEPIFKGNQSKMMFLKRYIQRAFAKEFWSINEDSAGLNMYNTEMNHAEARNMYGQALRYISANKTVLEASENMPAGFLAAFEASAEQYNEKLTAFENAENIAKEGTDTRVRAINEVYRKIQVVCADGQVVFAGDDTLKGEFSFEKQSGLVKPTGASTLVVELKDAETNMVIEQFEVVNMETGRSEETETGRVEMGQQAETPEGTKRNYKIMADGYPDKVIEVELNAGAKRIERISLMPLVTAAMKEEGAGKADATATMPEMVG